MPVWIIKMPWFFWLMFCRSCSCTGMVLENVFMAKRDDGFQCEEIDTAWKFLLSRSLLPNTFVKGIYNS